MPAPTPLVVWLQTAVPFWGSAADVGLRTLRLTLVLLCVLNPAFWLVYQHTSPGAVDPLWARAALAGGALALLAASYGVAWVRDHAHAVLAVLIQVILVWFGVLAAVNALDPDFASGYHFVVLGTAMIASMAWDRPGPLAGVLCSAVVVGVTAAVWGGEAAASPAVFLLIVVSGSVVFFIGFYGRLRASADLRRSEGRLLEAERLAGTGSWTHDLADERAVWSDGLYAIAGVARGDGPPPFEALVHPDDAPACRADLERLLATGETSQMRYRIVRPDGAVRWLDGTASVVTSTDRSRIQGVVLDVTAHVEREAALVEARDQAEAAHRTQSSFLANMSHEIRTPLTAIIGFAQVLQEEVPAVHAELVEPIESGGRRLLATLNSVLDLARMDAGETGLTLGDVDPAAEAAGVVAMLRPFAEGKGLALHLAPPSAPLAVRADPDALGRVLTNLVSNAVKFTEAGAVSVAVSAVGGRAEIVVADTGCGMDDGFLAELYEPFSQASTGWARSHEGTGLGLTITRRLVDAMGGALDVESRPGVGSRFTVSLALAAPPAVAGPDRPALPVWSSVSAPAPASA